MYRLAYIALFLFGTFATVTTLRAQENTAPAMDAVTPVHGVAMHGEVKYAPDFAHFSYVNPDAPKGGTIKTHVVGSFDSLNPFIIKGSPAAGMNFLGTNLIYESLMDQSYDEPFSMYGLLAESIMMPEDRSWVGFNLRPEAKWHDGKAITAEDVIWTFNTMMEKGTPFFKAYYGDVKKVEAKGERTVIFTFKHNGNAELPLILSQLSVLPKHYWEGREFDKTTLEPPLGSGPYKIKTASAGKSIEYVRVEDWWGKDLPINKGKYNFDRIVYDYYRDGNVALEAFFAGEYDVREENTAKLWAQAYDAQPVNDGRIVKEEIGHQRPQGLQGFIFNVRRDMFADREVRKALGYAFDFEWSNKQFAFGSYKRTRSYFSNSDLEATGIPEGRELEILEKYRDQIPPEVFTEEYHPPKTDGNGNPRRNLKTAMDILDVAGYKLGPDGIRVHETTGKRLEFEIIDNNPVFEKWVLPFIQNLKKIGVEANFRVVDPAQYQNRMSNFDFDMTIMSFGQSESPGNEQRDFWSSEKAAMNGSRNYIGVSNPAIDALIEEIIQATSREDLVHHVHALDRILQWNYYVIPQWHISHWRLAWWNKLKHPQTLSPITPAMTTTWWSTDVKDAQ